MHIDVKLVCCHQVVSFSVDKQITWCLVENAQRTKKFAYIQKRACMTKARCASVVLFGAIVLF